MRLWSSFPRSLKKKILLCCVGGVSTCFIFRNTVVRKALPVCAGMGLWALDTFVPQVNLFTRYFWRGQSKDALALTFDDGPDPRITPYLLDLLRRHKAKATFFHLVSKAKHTPVLVREIVSSGHEIGLHGLDHQKVWTMGLKKFRHQIEYARKTLEDLCAKPIFWYRPPHGFLRFDQYLVVRSMGLRLAGWTVGVWDTDEDVRPQEIYSRLLRSLRPGDILLLHDGVADKTRPQTAMLKALEEIMPVFSKQGLRLITLSQLWNETNYS